MFHRPEFERGTNIFQALLSARARSNQKPGIRKKRPPKRPKNELDRFTCPHCRKRQYMAKDLQLEHIKSCGGKKMRGLAGPECPNCFMLVSPQQVHQCSFHGDFDEDQPIQPIQPAPVKLSFDERLKRIERIEDLKELKRLVATERLAKHNKKERLPHKSKSLKTLRSQRPHSIHDAGPIFYPKLRTCTKCNIPLSLHKTRSGLKKRKKKTVPVYRCPERKRKKRVTPRTIKRYRFSRLRFELSQYQNINRTGISNANLNERCPNCHQWVRYSFMDTHLYEHCPERYTKCCYGYHSWPSKCCKNQFISRQFTVSPFNQLPEASFSQDIIVYTAGCMVMDCKCGCAWVIVKPGSEPEKFSKPLSPRGVGRFGADLCAILLAAKSFLSQPSRMGPTIHFITENKQLLDTLRLGPLSSINLINTVKSLNQLAGYVDVTVNGMVLKGVPGADLVRNLARSAASCQGAVGYHFKYTGLEIKVNLLKPERPARKTDFFCIICYQWILFDEFPQHRRICTKPSENDTDSDDGVLESWENLDRFEDCPLCHEAFHYKELSQHMEKECEMRKVICNICNFRVIAREIDSHQKENCVGRSGLFPRTPVRYKTKKKRDPDQNDHEQQNDEVFDLPEDLRTIHTEFRPTRYFILLPITLGEYLAPVIHYLDLFRRRRRESYRVNPSYNSGEVVACRFCSWGFPPAEPDLLRNHVRSCAMNVNRQQLPPVPVPQIRPPVLGSFILYSEIVAKQSAVERKKGVTNPKRSDNPQPIMPWVNEVQIRSVSSPKINSDQFIALVKGIDDQIIGSRKNATNNDTILTLEKSKFSIKGRFTSDRFPISCRYCKTQCVSKKEMRRHEKTLCDYRPTRCRYCDKLGTFNKIKKHAGKCF
eukprot:sb/3461946/